MYTLLLNLFTNLGLNETTTLTLLGLNIEINFALTLTTLSLILCIIAFICVSNAIINILNKFIHKWAHNSHKRKLRQ